MVLGTILLQMQQQVTCLGQCCSSILTCDKSCVTRRLPVRKEGPNRTRTGPADHFTESGINLSTRPCDANTHETVDYFLSPILVCLLECLPKCGNVMYLACSYSVQVARCMLGGVWARGACLGVPTFGSTSAVYEWHTIGCLPNDKR